MDPPDADLGSFLRLIGPRCQRSLTGAEIIVAYYSIVELMPTEEIAKRTTLAVGTVQTHVKRIRSKLGVHGKEHGLNAIIAFYWLEAGIERGLDQARIALKRETHRLDEEPIPTRNR